MENSITFLLFLIWNLPLYIWHLFICSIKQSAVHYFLMKYLFQFIKGVMERLGLMEQGRFIWTVWSVPWISGVIPRLIISGCSMEAHGLTATGAYFRDQSEGENSVPNFLQKIWYLRKEFYLYSTATTKLIRSEIKLRFSFSDVCICLWQKWPRKARVLLSKEGFFPLQ